MLAASACFIDETKSNSYALYHAQGVDENWRANHPGRRTVNLSRSGFTGIGKYGVMVWSGDQCARWDVLKAQIAEGQKIAMSGISHWNLDIGAFFVKNYMSVREDGSRVKRWFWNGDYNDGVADPEYRELYIRWQRIPPAPTIIAGRPMRSLYLPERTVRARCTATSATATPMNRAHTAGEGCSGMRRRISLPQET